MSHRGNIQGERGLPLVLDKPTKEYDQRLMSDIVRVINTWAQSLQNPGPVRASYIFCDTKFPINGNHLEVGGVFIDGDTLKVVEENKGYAPTFGLTMSLGSVTTTIA